MPNPTVKCIKCPHFKKRDLYCQRTGQTITTKASRQERTPYIYAVDGAGGRIKRIRDGCFDAFVIWSKRDDR